MNRYRVYDKELDKWYTEDEIVMSDGYLFKNFTAFEDYEPLNTENMDVYKVEEVISLNRDNFMTLVKIN